MSTTIDITCPSCHFSRPVPLEKLPTKAVTVTCPMCKAAFSFDGHVAVPVEHVDASAIEAQRPHPAAKELLNAKAPLASSPSAKKRLIDNPLVSQGVPVVVGIVFYALGVPWYVSVIVLLMAPYWFGPILIYFKQRMPTQQPLRSIPAGTSLPHAHSAFFNKTIPALQNAGFVSKGSFTNAREGEAISGVVMVMQHEANSDLAHLLVVLNNGNVGQMIGFSRPRTNGGRIRTSWSTITSPFPPIPQDSTLRVGNEMAPEVLWHIHQSRVAGDATAVREAAISDALSYQVNEERLGVEAKLASGQWQHTDQPGFIRPTLLGAYSMCLRMLFPWNYVNRYLAEREVRRYLKTAIGEPPVGEARPVEITNGPSGAGQDLELASLVTELQALNSEEKKFGSLTLLIITVMVFFSAQIVSTKWQELLILVGVLFFHELGHMLAMKLLKYTDLKMFFIPFFGAAVSGKNNNPTALKSCIVSLMGPLPGIVLSVGLFVLFLLTKNYYLFKTAQVMMLLNVFNLLPIMPLDGGRFVDVLFVNRRYFRFIFSFLGAAAFLFLAYSSQDFLMGLFGGLTIYVALTNLKVHGISRELKSEGIVATSVADLLSDQQAFKCVVEKIRPNFPKLFSPNLNYKGIFDKLTILVDTIKFKPAKFLPKTFLLGTYAGCTLASIFVFLVIGANYKECVRTVEVEGKNVTYAEHRILGKKRSECSINNQLFYDGKGTAYADDGSVESIYYYKDGYRTGEWLTYQRSGQVVEKRQYDRGRLLTVATLEKGVWRTKTVEDMPLLKRLSENIQQLSQPFKSNHEYF